MDKSDAKNNDKQAAASEATLIDSKHAHTPAAPEHNAALDKTMVTDQRPSNHGHPSGAPGSRPASKSPSSHGSSNTSFASMETLNLSVPIQDLNSEGMLSPTRRIPFDTITVPSLGGIPLLHKLGQGGMGAVYYGIHPGLRIEVAVKVLPLALAQPQMIQRFYREAQIAAKIQSPHLVAVRDVSEDSGLYYLVMEYVSGMSAGSYMRKLKKDGKKISEAEALEICIAASEGLAVAHRRGIIHRDIKPDNILIPKSDKAGVALAYSDSKLADLGLARNEDGAGGLTGTSSGLGTPGYMAPEQAADASKVKKAADVWSMGAAFYGLLAGRPPFRGDTPINIIMASMQSPHDPIKGERPDISDASARLIDICLSKQALERYVDGPALLEALKTCRAALHGGEQGQQKAIKQLADIQKAAEQGLPLPAMDSAALSGARGPAVKPGGKKKSPVGLIIAGVLLLAAGLAAVFVMTQKPKETGKKEPTPEELRNIELQKQIAALQQQLTEVAGKSLSKEQSDASTLLVSAFKKMQEGEPDLAKVNEINGMIGEAELGYPNHPGLPMLKSQLETKRKVAEAKAAEQKKRASFDGMVKTIGESIGKAELATIGEIDKQIQEAAKLYPEDPSLGALRKQAAEQKKKLEALDVERKKKARFDGLMKDASALFAAGKIDDAEKALVEPATLFAADPGLADLKKKIDEQRKIAAAETAKRASFDKGIAELDGKVDAATDLKPLETQLAELQKAYPTDPAAKKIQDRIETRRKALVEVDRRKTWETKVAALEGSIDGAADLTAVTRQIDTLNTDYPNDARISALKARVSAREAQIAEATRKRNYDNYMTTAADLIKRKQSLASLDQAEQNLRQAENLFRTKEVGDLSKKLADARRDLTAQANDTVTPGVPLTPKQQVKKNRPGEVDVDN